MIGWLTSVLTALFIIFWLFALVAYLSRDEARAAAKKAAQEPPPRPEIRYIVVPRPVPTAQPATKKAAAGTPPASDPDAAEVKAALMSLGMPAKAAEAALKGTTGTVEQRIKQALQNR